MVFPQFLHEERDGFLLSDDPTLIDVDRVHDWISDQSYWATGRSRELMVRALAGSHPIGVYRGTEQVAVCRIVSDGATFAWLCDVFVDLSARGLGIGTWLAHATATWATAVGIKRVVLVTRDAHEIYVRAGFAPLAGVTQWMEIDNRPQSVVMLTSGEAPEDGERANQRSSL